MPVHGGITLRVAGFALSLLLAASGIAASAQEVTDLPVGASLDGSTASETPASFRFAATSAGVLTVAAHALGSGDGDLSLLVTDDVGQPLSGGTVDMDLGGNAGAEILALPITGAGEYRVMVRSLTEAVSFRLAASWVAFAEFERPVDPDAKPTAAVALVPGSPLEDSISPGSGDEWDWFVVTPSVDGIVTVLIESGAGDLALEAFAAGSFTEALTSSDQDMDGVTGNETVTARGKAGVPVYFKVVAYYGTGDTIPYTIRAGVM